ncbi:MAG: suppressor of glycerol defect [Alectoria sarmentosa]|nr:MAG: suppressor of glycerol defect [Alectoria sarmentosa]
MRQPTRNTAKLPQQLLQELGISGGDHGGVRRKRGGPTNRKEQRKAARVQKKSAHVPVRNAQGPRRPLNPDDESESSEAPVIVEQAKVKTASVQPKSPKSILKKPRPLDERPHMKSLSPSPPPPRKLSRGVQDKLAADDAEIAALEKALGVKGKKKLPKSFEDDGLDTLLEGIDDAVGLNEGRPGKRKRSEEDEWLERKRQKALEGRLAIEDPSSSASSQDEDEDSVIGSGDEDEQEKGQVLQGQFDTDEDDEFESFGEEDEPPLPAKTAKRTRENPYVAPVTSSGTTEAVKYIPPSLRNRDAAGSEDLSQLRRQIQGLLNRLSEANLVSILGDMENIYRDHPRQHVTATLLDLLMGLLSDPTALQDTFVILHAGFIAAVYKIVGTDFGAQAIQRIDEDFSQNYLLGTDQDRTGKKMTNLISLLAELYNFQVIGSNLIYDFVRIFLNKLSETNTELLLKIIRNAGPQLRQDDPSSLKEIVLQLQAAVAGIGEEKLSVRTKFMIETINNLKNNRMKTGVAASTITSEHTTRMKRTLGSLNQRNIRASEPLRIGLQDLRQTDKRGKWWLVGASYKDDDADNTVRTEQPSTFLNKNIKDTSMNGVTADLMQLAKEQRMNTDVRRSIFIAVMSATDSNDAYVRLMKLRLKKSQELEIAKVLIHCAGAEKVYNPFYTILSRRVCSDKKLKMSFQFSLWDLFKQMGEGEDEPEADEEDNEGQLELRSLVNLAKMFGVLIAERGLGLGVLKNLNLAYLQTKTRTFVEILIITTIVHSQQGLDESRNEKVLLDICLEPKEMPEMASGLRYFLTKVVSKTDVAGSKVDQATVKWGCKVACHALSVMTTRQIPADD